MNLLALDPGLDEVGWAVLGFPLEPGATAWKAGTSPTLVAIGTWYCPPGALLELRLRYHAQELGELLTTHPCRHAVVERPVTSTVYERHRLGGTTATKQAGSLQVQQLVTGMLWQKLESEGVEAHFAAPTRKVYRTKDALTRIVGPLPRTSEHARAALALGLAALSDSRRRWAA